MINDPVGLFAVDSRIPSVMFQITCNTDYGIFMVKKIYLAVVVTVWAVLAGPQSVGAYLLAGYALAMLLNVVMPHVLATMVLRRYMPGLSTALALNLPVTILLLRSSFAQGYVSFPTFAYYGVAVCVALVTSIPVLFRIGEKVGSSSTPFHRR